MKLENVINIPPAPNIVIKVKDLNDKNVREYHPTRIKDHVLFRFQPTQIIKVRKEDYSARQIKQLEDWWSKLNLGVRDSPFVQDSQGVVIIWTFCGTDDPDFENGVYGDDCE